MDTRDWRGYKAVTAGTPLLEVVEDWAFWRLQAVLNGKVCAQDDGAAIVEVEAVGQHRVMAMRQKRMVQCLGDLVQSFAANVVMGGR
ncbi:hypothetical protein A5706_22485 [Mycobacterium sp. E796]|nr:hypothetical protein A5706_22485 [Mycobacterium sp. E796]